MIANLHPCCLIWQVRLGLALRYDSFDVLFARKPEHSVAVLVDVVAVKKTFAALGHDRVKSQLAVDQR